MKKKFLLTTFLAIAVCLAFSFSCVLATTNTNPVEGIRNAVGGAENVVENVAGDITNGVKNGTSTVTNTMENKTGTDGNTDNKSNTIGAIMTDNNNNGYTAARTATTGEPTMAGIKMTTWSWIILAVAAVGIITIIWSYLAQKKNNYDSYND